MARLSSEDALLLRLPSWLGDFVMAEPAIAALDGARRAGRLARLSLAGPERFFDLLEGRFEGAARLAPDDDWGGHHAALFLDGSARGPWRALRAGIGARFGWRGGGRGALLTDGLRPALERGLPAVGRGRRGSWPRRLPRPFGSACAELVGLAGVAVVERAPRLEAGVAARRSAAARRLELGLAEGEPYVLVDASARPGSAKAPPAELWVDVLRELRAGGAPAPLLVGAPGESELARRVALGLGEPETRLFDEPPPTLGELLALVEGCALFLGPDSGPRHLAVAAGRPQVVLCGPTDPRHTADHLERARVLRREVDCGPCHRERCPLPAGPEHLACFAGLEPRRIAAAALEGLRSSRPAEARA